jgi:hypothetical protein
MTHKYVGLAVFLVAVLLSGCSRDIEVHEAVSPDKKVVLRIEINEGGGAAVSDETGVYLYLFKDGLNQKKAVFKGFAMGNFVATWEAADVVALSYSGGYITTCNSVTSLSSNIEVTTHGCGFGNSPGGPPR